MNNDEITERVSIIPIWDKCVTCGHATYNHVKERSGERLACLHAIAGPHGFFRNDCDCQLFVSPRETVRRSHQKES
jgi:hypothetical protein